MKSALVLLQLTLVILHVHGYTRGSPICTLDTNAISQSVMMGPFAKLGDAGGVVPQVTPPATMAGNNLVLTYTLASGNMLGLLVFAQYTNGDRQGQFDITQCYGDVNAYNASNPKFKYVDTSVCPGDTKATITQAYADPPDGVWTLNFKTNPSYPGTLTFKAIVQIDKDDIPTNASLHLNGAFSNWYLMPDVVVQLAVNPTAPAIVASQTKAAAATTPAAAKLATNTIIGIALGVILGVLLISLFLFPIIWAKTHKDDPRVQRFTQRMTQSFKR